MVIRFIEEYKLESAKIKGYHGLNNIDKALLNYLDYENGYFVELGANDGIKQSNTFYLESHRGWRGMLVEPVVHNYFKCIANRSKDTKVFCNACVSFSNDSEFVEIIYCDLMSVMNGIEHDIKSPRVHAELGRQFLRYGESIVSFGSKTITLNQLLIDAQAPLNIDLLSLDVEGAEMEVLRGIDHTQYRFKIICVEARDFNKISRYLSSCGYEYLESLSNQDFIFRDSSM